MLLLPTSKEAVREALENGSWLIGCSCPAGNPCDYTGLVLENVWRYEAAEGGYWAAKLGSAVIISYGISPVLGSDDSGHIYRIHDDSMAMVRDGAELDAYAQSILLTYDAVLVDNKAEISREFVYGRLGTAHADDIVFFNEV